MSNQLKYYYRNKEKILEQKKSKYWEHRETHLKAQKKYDDKNREKKREYDKLRWQKRKLEHQALLDIEELLLNEEQPIQPGYIRYNILEIIKKVLGE